MMSPSTILVPGREWIPHLLLITFLAGAAGPFLPGEESGAMDPVLDTLLELKDKEGKDNAIIHYRRAYHLAPPAPDKYEALLIRKVLEKGWTLRAEPLLSHLEKWQPAFQEFRAGAGVGYAKNVLSTKTSSDIAPFLEWKGVIALCVEGRYLESLGEYGRALDNHLISLQMLSDVCAPDTSRLGFVTSLMNRPVTYGEIQRLIRTGKMDRELLVEGLRRLRSIEIKFPTTADMLRSEPTITKERLLNDLEIAQRLDERFVPKGTEEQLKDAIRNHQQVVKEYREFLELKARQLSVAFSERDPSKDAREREAFFASRHPYVQTQAEMASYDKVDEMDVVDHAQIRILQVEAALELQRADKGGYPGELREIASHFGGSIPTDPFTGGEFVYRPKKDGKGYTLYSVGPDKRDEGGQKAYEPDGSPFKIGDVFIRSAFTE